MTCRMRWHLNGSMGGRFAALLIGVAMWPATGVTAPVVAQTQLDINVLSYALPDKRIVVAGGTGVMRAKAIAGAASDAFDYSLKKNADATFDATGIVPRPGVPEIKGTPALRLRTNNVASAPAAAAASTAYALALVKVQKNNQEVEALEANMTAAVFAADKGGWAKAEVGDPLFFDSVMSADALGLQVTMYSGSKIGTTLAQGGGPLARLTAGHGVGAADNLLDIALSIMEVAGSPDLIVSARLNGAVDTAMAAYVDQHFVIDPLTGMFTLDQDLPFDFVLGAVTGQREVAFALSTEAGAIAEPGRIWLLGLALALLISARARAAKPQRP